VALHSRHPDLLLSLRGFTLMELLVAMVLMVSVAACLYTALYTGFRAHRSALQAVEPTLQALNAIELLKEDVLGVMPPGDSNSLAGAFVGKNDTGIKGVDTDSLEFYTTHVYADKKSVHGGIGKVALFLEEEDARNQQRNFTTYKLMREVSTNLLAPRTEVPVEQVLCRDVVSLNLRYYDGDGWVDEWDSSEDSNSLPQAVEVDIKIAYHRKTGRRDKNSVEVPEQRRLVQIFAVPCKTAEETSTDTGTSKTKSSGTTSGGSTSGGSTSGGTTR
jgi:prepilin-type N-terminal cleavage/methylation domain-containing protein